MPLPDDLHLPKPIHPLCRCSMQGAEIGNFSFVFSIRAPSNDALLHIELHFQRVIALADFKIMAPCQFVGQRPTFWK